MLASRKIAAVAVTAAAVFGSAGVAPFADEIVESLEAGDYYAVFAQEKEGGAIPAPCGTRLE